MPKVNFEKKKKETQKAEPKKNNGNPFKKARKAGKRLKLFLWGDTGTHKTILSLQFPSPVVIDLERGTELYGKSFSFHVADPMPTNAQEVVDLIDWLLTNKHSYKTLAIDPVTVFWEMLQKKWSDIFIKRNRSSKGFKHEYYDLQVKDWQTIKSEWKDIIRKLINLDMNVIVTARQKAQYADSEFMRKVGDTFDGEKTLPYMFDTVLQMYKGPEDVFMARCIKDRSNHFKEGKEIKNPSYAMFEELFGKTGLNRKAKPQEDGEAKSEKSEQETPSGEQKPPDTEQKTDPPKRKRGRPKKSEKSVKKDDKKADVKPKEGETYAEKVNRNTREEIARYLRELGATKGDVKKSLSRYGAQSLDDLSNEQAEEIHGKLGVQVKMKREKETGK